MLLRLQRSYDLADLGVEQSSARHDVHKKGRGRGARARARPALALALLLLHRRPLDPREYQPPHPDDRGADGKPTKKGGGAKGKAKAKATDSAEGKGKAAEDGDAHRCGNCDAPDAKSKCKGCGVVYYCNRECQKVGCHR